MKSGRQQQMALHWPSLDYLPVWSQRHFNAGQHGWKMENTKWGRKSLLRADRLTCNVFMLGHNLGTGVRNRWWSSSSEGCSWAGVLMFARVRKVSASSFRPQLKLLPVSWVCNVWHKSCATTLEKKWKLIQLNSSQRWHHSSRVQQTSLYNNNNNCHHHKADLDPLWPSLKCGGSLRNKKKTGQAVRF